MSSWFPKNRTLSICVRLLLCRLTRESIVLRREARLLPSPWSEAAQSEMFGLANEGVNEAARGFMLLLLLVLMLLSS